MYSGSRWQDSGIPVLFGAFFIVYLFSFSLFLVKFYNLATYGQYFRISFFMLILGFTVGIYTFSIHHGGLTYILKEELNIMDV